MPLPGDDPMLGGLDSSGDFGDFALYDTQAMAADEPFLSALVDSWPELQHEQVGLPVVMMHVMLDSAGQRPASGIDRLLHDRAGGSSAEQGHGPAPADGRPVCVTRNAQQRAIDGGPAA